MDEGTSVLVDAQASADFHAQTTLQAVADLFMRQGLPSWCAWTGMCAV